MTTLTIHLNDDKSEQAIKAVLNALGVAYDEVAEDFASSSYIIAGVRKAQSDLKEGRVKDYEGLMALLGRS